MELMIFVVVFVAMNIVLLKWAKKGLNDECSSVHYETCYITMFAKGAVRGIIGNFASNNDLEEKRILLKNNSNF